MASPPVRKYLRTPIMRLSLNHFFIEFYVATFENISETQFIE